MKKLLVALFSCFFICSVFAQTNHTKKNSFVFNVGLSYRATPLDLKKQPFIYEKPFYYERDRQISGLAVNFGLLYYLEKPKLGFEYSNSVRYDILYFENGPLEIYDKRIFTIDYHFNMYKFFPVKKNTLRTGVGFSALNTGSDYTYMEPTVFNGVTLYQSSYDNFHFNSFNVIFGYLMNQISFELVNRFSTQHRFYSTGQFYIPELKLTYNVMLKNKKVFE